MVEAGYHGDGTLSKALAEVILIPSDQSCPDVCVF